MKILTNIILLMCLSVAVGEASERSYVLLDSLTVQGRDSYQRSLLTSLEISKETTATEDLAYEYWGSEGFVTFGESDSVYLSLEAPENLPAIYRDPATNRLSTDSSVLPLVWIANQTESRLRPEPELDSWTKSDADLEAILSSLELSQRDEVNYRVSEVDLGAGETGLLFVAVTDEFDRLLPQSRQLVTQWISSAFVTDREMTHLLVGIQLSRGAVGEGEQISTFETFRHLSLVPEDETSQQIDGAIASASAALGLGVETPQARATSSQTTAPFWLNELVATTDVYEVIDSVELEGRTNPLVLGIVIAIHKADALYGLARDVLNAGKEIFKSGDYSRENIGSIALDNWGKTKTPLGYLYEGIARGGAVLAQKAGLIEESDVSAVAEIGGKILHLGASLGSGFKADKTARQLWSKIPHLESPLMKNVHRTVGKMIYGYKKNPVIVAQQAAGMVSTGGSLKELWDSISDFKDDDSDSKRPTQEGNSKTPKVNNASNRTLIPPSGIPADSSGATTPLPRKKPQPLQDFR